MHALCYFAHSYTPLVALLALFYSCASSFLDSPIPLHSPFSPLFLVQPDQVYLGSRLYLRTHRDRTLYSVDTLHEAAPVLELSWFAYTADFVFDAVRQTGIKLVTKGGVAITLELRREAVELHNVVNDSLRVLHPQVVELVLGVSDGVVRAKLELEFCDELAPIVHPEGTIICVEGTEEVRFEPLKRHTFEV